MAPSKNRVAKFRETLKNDPLKWEAHLQKEKNRDALRRKVKKESTSGTSRDARMLMKLTRQRNSNRQRLRRLKKKELINKTANDQLLFLTPTKSAYKCPQSRSKAVLRTQRAMPQSPRKRLEVVRNILLKEIPTAAFLLKRISTSPRINKLDEETTQKVVEFYQTDSISRQEPGKRDVVSVKDKQKNTRLLVQKRIMLMTIGEALALFNKQYPLVKIKRSKFFDLRPQHVLPVSNMPHNVCVCKYHANMDFLIKSIAGLVKDFPHDGRALIDSLVCNQEDESCMLSACTNCNDKDGQCLFGLIDDVHLDNELTWKFWSDLEGRPQIVSKKGTIQHALDEIQKQITYYKMHVFVKRTQAESFENVKRDLEPEVGVLQMDFAENFSTIAQDEIQSAHWSHGQITVFTAVAWLAGGKVCSYVVVSDDLLHGKVSVWVYFKCIIEELKKECPQLRKLKIFSDGCAAQFKNKFTLSNLLYMQEDFGISADWSFLATSHGKGAVDGVGGIVKRCVWLRVKSRKVIINSADDFTQCAREAVQNVTILQVTAEQVASYEHFLMNRWENIRPIPRLQTIHYVKIGNAGSGTLLVGLTNKSVMNTVNVIKADDLIDIECCSGANLTVEDIIQQNVPLEIGSFVKVELPVDGQRIDRFKSYFAEVLDLDDDNNQISLKYMHPSGINFWVWPDPIEVSWETTTSISLRKVNPPTLVNNRGQFKFCLQ